MYTSGTDEYFNFITKIIMRGDQLANSRIYLGGQFKTFINNNFYLTPNLFYTSAIQLLFDIKGFDNINQIDLISENEDYINLIKGPLSAIAINEDAVEKFIEKNVIKESKDQIPIEILKTLKGNMMEQGVIGHLGMTTGKIIRQLVDKETSMLCPVLSQDDQASDTFERFKKIYHDMYTKAETEGEKKSLVFQNVYTRLALINIDQLQNTILYLKGYKEANINYWHTLYFKTPSTNIVPTLNAIDNIWCNKHVVDNGIESITFYLMDGKLSASINISTLVICDKNVLLISYVRLLLLLITTLLNVAPGEITFNIGCSIIPAYNTSSKEFKDNLLPKESKVYQVLLKEFKELNEINLDYLSLEE